MRTAVLRALAVAATGLAVACSASPQAPPAQPTTAPTAAPNPDPGLTERLKTAVTGDGVYRHLEELQRIADANGGNRALGTPGYDASVEYVAQTLRDAGYQVDTPGFSARSFSVQDVRLTVDGTPVPAASLGFSPATPPGGASAPLAVLSQDETSGCEPDDFAGVPAGSVVLIRRGTCPFGQKVTNAAAAGAAAALVANNVDGPLTQATLGDVTGAVPTAGVSKADGDTLAGRAGAPVTLVLATTIEERQSRNVIAQTATGDVDNVVMAGAHLDSVPEGPGINDNGSGTAALLETAVQLGGAPAVTNAVRFAFWGAEEEGLIGSTAYVGGLGEADREKISLYLNLDMVGSPNAGYLAYDGDNSDNEGAGPGTRGLRDGRARAPRAAVVDRRGRDGHRLRRALGLRTVRRRRDSVGWAVHRRRGDQDAGAGAALGRHGGPTVRPLLPPGVRPHRHHRPHRAGPQHRRRRRLRRPLRPVHGRRPGLTRRQGPDGARAQS